MNLSDLQRKDVVSLNTGKKLGRIIDAQMNQTGMIEFFVVMERHFFRFWKVNGEIDVKIAQIEKIGTDVILIKDE